MDAGSTFLLAKDYQVIDNHLWVILSDAQQFPDQVVIVNITTHTPEKDQACLIAAKEHGWLRHDSCVSNAHAKVVTLAMLWRWKDTGLIAIQDSLGPQLLERIRQLSGDSITLPPDIADILVEQGIIRLDD